MSFQTELSVLLMISYSAKHNSPKCQTNNYYLESRFLLLKASQIYLTLVEGVAVLNDCGDLSEWAHTSR